MPLFVHDNGAVHYLERGRGEPLLLIHGLGSSGADWALQVAALERRFRVIAPDLPGCGHSAAPRGGGSIAGFAASLWALLDHLEAPRVNIVGFSLGGAVGIEMALQRPEAVHRLGLINSLASYRLDHWSKFLEAVLPMMLIPLVGMRRAAHFAARRLFPMPWQRPLRDRAAQVVSAVPVSSYLGTGRALIGWSAIDRLHHLKSKVLMIAAERDLTPLAEKRALAARLGAEFVLVRGSRHGTPFDAVKVTNASLLALLTDQPLPPPEQWTCDEATHAGELPLTGTIAEEHARHRLYSPASPVAG
ncbi:MAG TPA: alpha/beta hydrolase [Steroidobacteraceae bacterium]|jgi:3-oxoadipate enol-lactonase|nr:alpha/beta hydrolase [Steroidobacteraceae bacterium]